MIRLAKIIDNGLTLHSKPARYEQHFVDGTIIYSDTLPDRNAFKMEYEKQTKFAIGDTVDIMDDYGLRSDRAMNPWQVYGIEIASDKISYKLCSEKHRASTGFWEEALKLHAT